MNGENTTLLHAILSIAGMCLWGYLLIVGRQLSPSTTLALLLLILATAGLGQLATDFAGTIGAIYGGPANRNTMNTNTNSNSGDRDRDQHRDRPQSRDYERDTDHDRDRDDRRER